MRRLSLLLLLFVALELSARQPVHAKRAMVIAQEPFAADVGVAVLKSGGNAIDAAVAVGFALAVSHPEAGNIGGGGFMVIRTANGKVRALDYRETAPAHATGRSFSDRTDLPGFFRTNRYWKMAPLAA